MSALDDLISADMGKTSSQPVAPSQTTPTDLSSIISQDLGTNSDVTTLPQIVITGRKGNSAESQAAPASSTASTSQINDFGNALWHHLGNMPHGLAQLVENGIDYGAQLLPKNSTSDYIHSIATSDNQAMVDREKQYQANTPDSAGAYAGATIGEIAPLAFSAVGNTLKSAGNAAASLTAKLLPTGAKTIPQMVGGAAQGGLSALAQPVTENGNYLDNKINQLGVGAGFGAASPLAIRGLTSMISPNVSPAYSALNSAGVNTTIGQRLGGVFNSLEEKAQSIPIIGDFISQARNRSLESYNQATLNQVLKPIGKTVSTAGHDGVAEAGDKLSSAYNNVLGKIGGVTFDPQFHQDFGQLKQLSTGLTPDMANRFNNILENNFQSRLSPVGGMDAQTLKTVSSDIGTKARQYSGSANASEQELGDALTQMGSLVNQQIGRANPTLAPTLDAIDTGWAKLVRVEGAAKSAATNKGNTGIFTPGQLMSAVRGADQSTRDRATARGQALMQDWAQNGLQVLGDRVPNSGTFDRGANAGLLAALASNPQFIPPAAVAAAVGGGAYSSMGQGLLKYGATARPPQAKALSGLLNSFISATP